jgi:hypothetical protein
MEAITKRMIVDQDGFIKVAVPPDFGKQVEVILKPVSYEQDQDEPEYFECVAEDGTVYRIRDWDDDEFNKASMISALKDDDTTVEELFDV